MMMHLSREELRGRVQAQPLMLLLDLKMLLFWKFSTHGGDLVISVGVTIENNGL